MLKCVYENKTDVIEAIQLEKQLLIDFTAKYGQNSELVPSFNIPKDATLPKPMNPNNCYIMSKMDENSLQYFHRNRGTLADVREGDFRGVPG